MGQFDREYWSCEANRIILAEDKSLPRRDRKQAIFWLGQMKSDAAVLYLDKLLSVTAQN